MNYSLRAYSRHRKSLGLPGGTLYAVQKALRDGRIRALPDGTIDPAQADADWLANTDEGHRRGAGIREPLSADLQEARRKREHFAAEQARMNYEAKAGRMVSRVEVAAAIWRAIHIAEQRLLALPARLAPMVVGLELDTLERLLGSEIRRELEELVEEMRSKVAI